MANAASIVIDRLGGFKAVAAYLSVSKSSVHRWTYPKERGGTGGTIPQRHFSALLEMATEKDIQLSPVELITGTVTAP